jgi:subfamily B ATP-binding cassette protein MsbA
MKHLQLKAVLSEFKLFFGARKGRVGLGILGIQGVPLLEFALVSTIYGMIDPAKLNRLLSFLGFAQFDSGPIRMALFAIGNCILVFYIVLKYFHDLNLILLKEDLHAEYSHRLIDSYLNVDLPTAQKVGRDRISTSVINDGDALGALMLHFSSLAAGVIALLLYAIGAGAASWKVLLSAGVLALLPLWVNRKFTPLYAQLGKKKLAFQERTLGFFTDMALGFARTKTDALELELGSRSKTVLKQGRDYRIGKRRAQSTVANLTTGISFLGVLCTVYLGLAVFDVSVPTIMILFVMFARMRVSVAQIGENFLLITEYLPNANRMIDLVHLMESQSIVGRPESALPKISELEFSHVKFGYSPDVPVLKDVSFHFRAGDQVWLKGESGQGKSTLFSILTGLLRPTGGDIRMNGSPLHPSDQLRLRDQVTLVSPTVYLFNTTLRDNLLVGVPAERHRKLDEALSRSGLAEVVAQMPEGLETQIRRDGENVSLGQRQRIILARMFLRDASVILLDEATANLDRDLEEKVLEQVRQIVGTQAILIVISHKRPPVLQFTQCLELRDGEVVPLKE